jgi:SAM-dependent methyltransferase
MRGLIDPADELDAEMIAYYAARAPEYDEWYLRSDRYVHTETDDAAWKADLDQATRWLDRIPMAGEIVELAAGTGWWSPHLATKARLTVCDSSPEMLGLARSRLSGLGLAAPAAGPCIADAGRSRERIRADTTRVIVRGAYPTAEERRATA